MAPSHSRLLVRFIFTANYTLRNVLWIIGRIDVVDRAGLASITSIARPLDVYIAR